MVDSGNQRNVFNLLSKKIRRNPEESNGGYAMKVDYDVPESGKALVKSILMRLGMPPKEFYQRKCPGLVRERYCDGNFVAGAWSVMVPLQFWYMRTEYGNGGVRHHMAREPYTDVFWTLDGDNGYFACSCVLSARSMGILDAFSKRIESEPREISE
ncbi:MAG: hypothetical protein HYY37_06305 [Candidatus Aenigmarchaeota archaeon]|nr:hypothetical protein [Candidatus Aenigmarchaeota archaeon]